MNVRHNRRRAEAATRWIIQNRGVSYRVAAARFVVPIDAIRARIMNRWGSLEMARLAYATGTLGHPHASALSRCVSCGGARADDIALCEKCAGMVKARKERQKA